MAFTHKLPEAARRHLQAAEILYAEPGHRRDVAGYLFGIAAECAIKHMVIPIRMPPEHDKQKIVYSHFPELRSLLRDALSGRRFAGTPLFRFVFQDAFMNNWDTAMRYADARQIKEDWVRDWQRQARDAVSALET
jgi:hypothetical protein